MDLRRIADLGETYMELVDEFYLIFGFVYGTLIFHIQNWIFRKKVVKNENFMVQIGILFVCKLDRISLG